MNITLPEMVNCNGTDITVLERQHARVKWQIQQQTQLQQSYFNDTHLNFLANSEQFLMNSESMMKIDPEMFGDFGKFSIPRQGFGGFGSNLGDMVDCSLSRTASCPPAVVVGGKENLKKRKADKAQNPKGVVAEEPREKRSKVDSDEESKVTEQSNNNNCNKSTSNSNITTITTTTTTTNNNSKENSGDSSKANSKVSEGQKPDYIHVRARRGQATDSHSLAERVRREKISERMKYLQDLVPGCNKITGKAGMLDEIINYVQSLQKQVEFLSMKLATVNPRLDFNMENLFMKELYPACTGGFPPIGISPEMANCSSYLPFNPVQQQVVSCGGMDMVINPPEMALRRTISAPINVPDPAILETPCFIQAQPSLCWENDLQSLYNVEFNQGRATVFPPQSFTETLEANNLKMEM